MRRTEWPAAATWSSGVSRGDNGNGSTWGGVATLERGCRPPARCDLNLNERFESEVMPHARALYGTAFRLTRSPEDAEDLVQETLLRAYRGFASFRPGSNARAWLYTILHRVRTDTLRKRGRSPSTVEMRDEGPPVAPEHEAILTAGNEDVQQALSDVPEVFRSALVLRDVEEFSYDEIATVLGVPVGTVMSRIHRGRARLRRALAGRRS